MECGTGVLPSAVHEEQKVVTGECGRAERHGLEAQVQGEEVLVVCHARSG